MNLPATETLTRANLTGKKKINVYKRVKSKSYKYTVQCLRLCTSNAEALDSVPGRGTEIPHALQPKNFFFF